MKYLKVLLFGVLIFKNCLGSCQNLKPAAGTGIPNPKTSCGSRGTESSASASGVCHLHFLLSDLIEQAELVVIQLLGQVDVDLVRVHQTAGLFPQSILFLHAVGADIHGLGRSVNAFAVLEQGDHELAQGELTGCQPGLFPGFHGIEEGEGLVLAVDFFLETDDICLYLVFGLS